MEWLEIIKYTVPSLVVLLSSYLMVKMLLENDLRKIRQELRRNNQSLITPVRLQAIEKTTLFLERISPEALVVKMQQQGMSSGQLHQQLLSTIRHEYEQVISQQIYLSGSSWQVVKTSKENTVKLINTAADRVDPSSPAFELSRKILEILMQLETSPTAVALEFVRKEAEKFF